MASRPQILKSAQAQFPASANKTVTVANAWRRQSSTLERPEPNATDGWTPIHRPATREVLLDLKAQGYTVINLVAGGTAMPFRDVPITVLI